MQDIALLSTLNVSTYLLRNGFRLEVWPQLASQKVLSKCLQKRILYQLETQLQIHNSCKRVFD